MSQYNFPPSIQSDFRHPRSKVAFGGHCTHSVKMDGWGEWDEKSEEEGEYYHALGEWVLAKDALSATTNWHEAGIAFAELLQLKKLLDAATVALYGDGWGDWGDEDYDEDDDDEDDGYDYDYDGYDDDGEDDEDSEDDGYGEDDEDSEDLYAELCPFCGGWCCCKNHALEHREMMMEFREEQARDQMELVLEELRKRPRIE